MAFNKKIWKDRVAEFINRRLLTKEDGSTELVTVARSEGTISVEGDAFNAETMNDLEDRVEAAFNELNTNMVQKNSFIAVAGLLKDTAASDMFDLGTVFKSAPYLIAAQIQLESGVWTDMRSISDFKMINNNTKQVRVEKTNASVYANYQVRFLLYATQ